MAACASQAKLSAINLSLLLSAESFVGFGGVDQRLLLRYVVQLLSKTLGASSPPSLAVPVLAAAQRLVSVDPDTQKYSEL